MDRDSPFDTAMVRGLIVALGAALVAGITAYLAFSALIDDLAQEMGDITDNEILGYAVLTGALAGLATFALRGLVEGRYDQGRSDRREVKRGDVGWMPPPHPSVPPHSEP